MYYRKYFIYLHFRHFIFSIIFQNSIYHYVFHAQHTFEVIISIIATFTKISKKCAPYHVKVCHIKAYLKNIS